LDLEVENVEEGKKEDEISELKSTLAVKYQELEGLKTRLTNLEQA